MSRTGTGEWVRPTAASAGGAAHGAGLRHDVFPTSLVTAGGSDVCYAKAPDPATWGDWDTDGYYDSGTALWTVPAGLGGVYYLALDVLIGCATLPTSGFVTIGFLTPLSASTSFRLNFNQFTGGVGNRGAHGFAGITTVLVAGDAITIFIENSTNENMLVTDERTRFAGWLLVPE